MRYKLFSALFHHKDCKAGNSKYCSVENDRLFFAGIIMLGDMLTNIPAVKFFSGLNYEADVHGAASANTTRPLAWAPSAET